MSLCDGKCAACYYAGKCSFACSRCHKAPAEVQKVCWDCKTKIDAEANKKGETTACN